MNRDLTSTPFYHVDIPRTASRSIREALGLKGNFWMHLSAQQKKERAKRWDEAWVFTVVRNPYSRIVSQFKHRRVFHERTLNAVNFYEWCQERYVEEHRPRKPDTDYFERLWWPQRKYLTDPNGSLYDITVFQFEELERAWEQVQKRLGISKELPHENEAIDSTPWQEFYGEGAGGIIRDHFSSDFEEFGYDKDAV